MKHLTDTRGARLAGLPNRGSHAYRQVRLRKWVIVTSGVTVIAIERTP
jgi:hypothetical protein